MSSSEIGPKTVYIDFEFTRIGEIDTMNEKYYAEVSFQLSWTENKLIEKYDRNKDWNPQISIENMFVKPDETIEYQTIVKDSSTIITEKRKVKGYLWERLELQNFPFDVQELSVVLISRLDDKSLKLVGRNYSLGYSTLHTFVDQQKWRLLNLVDCTSTASYDVRNCIETITFPVFGEEYESLLSVPKLSFKCFACRRPYYYFANAYFLIFLVTITAIGIFSIDCKLPQNRLQTTATFLLTSVSFKWVINRSLPTVSYTTSLDQYSILCILYLCLLCVWHSIVGVYWTKALATEIDRWVLLVYACLFILMHIYFAFKCFKSYVIVREVHKRSKEYLKRLEVLKKSKK